MGHRNLASLPTVSVFFSFTQHDNAGQFDWIEGFTGSFQRTLSARLNGKLKLQVDSYVEKPLVQGDLDAELAKKIKSASAMVIFVHDKYLESEDCANELRMFQDSFGVAGLNSRLFVVAMSEDAMGKVADRWGATVNAGRKQLWINFSDKDVPFEIDSLEFKRQMRLLLAEMESRLTNPPPLETVPARAASQTVRRWVIGACVSDLDKEVELLRQRLLQQVGNQVTMLSRESLVESDLSDFANADELVLAFNDASFLHPASTGGHFGIQQSAWEREGKPLSRIHWLDLKHVIPKKPASPSQLKTLEWMTARSVTMDQLTQHDETIDASSPALLYIESNHVELDHWDALGRQLKPRWQKVTGGSGTRLDFLHRGLPINHLARFPTLNEADGFILLWGKKDPESLVAHIRAVETRVRSCSQDLPPGIVAYLVPPQEQTPEAVPAYGWRVLRFDASHEDNIDIVSAESDRLEKFLRQVHARVMRRRMAQPEAA